MNDLKIILVISTVLVSPFFINEAFAFTEVNNTTGFIISPSSGHGNILNPSGDTTCPIFSNPPDYFYFTSVEIRIPVGGGLLGICERAFAEFDVSSISTFTNVVRSIELKLDIITENLDTRVCDFNSMEVQASLISGVSTSVSDAFRVSVHNDIGDGTTFLTGVGLPFCDDPPLSTGNIIDLGSLAVTDMNDAFDVSQSFWGVGVKYTDESRPASLVNCPAGGFNPCNIRIVFDNPELRINYTTITDNVLPVIIITGDNPASVLKDTFYGDEGATATDDFQVDSANIVSVSNVDTSTLGTFQVTYNVNDRVGNPATEVIRTVNVIEATVNIISGGGGGGERTTTTGGVTQSVPSLSDIPSISVVPSEPTKPPTRTLDEVFDLFSFLFREVEPIPTLEVVPESVTEIPPPLSQPLTPTEEIRPSFIESIQNFFAGLFG